MFIFAGRLGLALVLAALCLGGRTAHAQSAPAPYWFPSWPFGFGGNPTAGPSSNPYGDFSSFNGSDIRGGSFAYNFPNGWFVEGGSTSLNMSGISQYGVFDNLGSLDHQAVQFGYNFQNGGGLPFKVYGGFDSLNFKDVTGIGAPMTPFDTVSGTVPGYGAHAGIEFQPASNVSLSLGLGYTQFGR
jgi:opacity protein-like surface antigen